MWGGGGEGGEGAGGRLISDVPLLLIIISCTQTLLKTENADNFFFTSIALAPHIVHTHFLRNCVGFTPGQSEKNAKPIWCNRRNG